MAQNRVIAGDYSGAPVSDHFGRGIVIGDLVYPVKEYEVLTEEIQRSASSGIAKGLIGSFFLGSVGALAGVSSAKTKGTYTVAIRYGEGKRSLVEVDEKIYKAIVVSSF